MEGRNVRFSLKKKGSYSKKAFCVKVTQLFIFSYLRTPWKMLLYFPFKNTRALFCFNSTIDENTDTLHLTEGFVF